MFDHYIAGTKPSWKRRALIIVSFALHGVAAVGLIIWSVFHVEEITPPVISLTFLSAPPPPPPPPPPAGRKPVEQHKPKVPKVVQQPNEIPKLVQPAEPEKPEPEDEGEEGGVEGGVVGGVKGGVVGGVVGGVLGGTPQPPPPAKVVPSFVLDQQLINKPDPHLPESIGTKGQQIRGTYRICVRQDGHVSDVSVVSSIGGADSSIIEQIKKTWLYRPQALPVCTIRNFQFIIR